jgi:hypothetical protein
MIKKRNGNLVIAWNGFINLPFNVLNNVPIGGTEINKVDKTFDAVSLLTHIVGYHMCSVAEVPIKYRIYHILTGKQSQNSVTSFESLDECITELYAIYGKKKKELQKTIALE